MLTAVKICGLCRPADASAVAAAGARYAGVVLSAVGPRAQHREAAGRIWAQAGAALRVGVFVNESMAGISTAVRDLGLDVVQLHGSESLELARTLRAGTGCRIWKAIRPRSGADFLAGLEAWQGVVEGLLLDGWSAVQAGGTGTAFPWSVVEPYRDRIPRGMDLIVAGGLGPGNVGEVVRRLRPDVVDVSSGVESGICEKSESLIRRFVAAVGAADRSRQEGVGGGRGVGSS